MDHSHPSVTSTKSTYPTSARSLIEYKRPTVILVLATLTLYPSTSPLFYVTCLPILILLHRYDLRLFIVCTSVCVGLVSLAAELSGGREFGSACIHSLMGVGTIVGPIVVHHSLLAFGGRSAWSDSLLFGLLWSGCGIISRVVHFTTSTPSSARYESLRFLSRNVGEIGIDLLLAITGYTVFMALQVFFPPPSEEDRKFSEWIKMIPLDKDAVILQSIWSGSTPASTEDHEPHSAFTRSTQSTDDTAPTSGPLLGSRWLKRESPTQRMNMRIGSTSSGPRSYGTFRSPNDLIDLESARSRTYSVFSYPSISALASSTETRSAGSVDTDVTLVSSDPTTTTTSSIGNELLASLMVARPKEPKYLKFFILAITLLWASIFIQPLPAQVSLSAPLVEHTPLSVACIIPQTGYTSADLVYLSQTVSGRVKLIIWPDDLVVNTEWQRDVLVEGVHQAIGIQYGVWTLISVLVEEAGVKERILVGPEGGVRPGEGGTDWTIYLPPPTGVTRLNWTTAFPHYRPLHFAATSPSNYPTIPETDNPPSLLIVPSTSESTAQLSHAQELAIKHGTPAILCSDKLSAVIDASGRILFQQSGGSTWSLSLALWFREGEDRQWTGYEIGYGSWLFGTGVAILSICATISYIAKNNKDEMNSGAGAATDINVSERDMWSNLNPQSSRTVTCSSRKQVSTTSYTGIITPPT